MLAGGILTVLCFFMPWMKFELPSDLDKSLVPKVIGSQEATRGLNFTTLSLVMETEGQKIVALAEKCAQEWGIKFVGIDASLAPMGEESIAYAMEKQLPGCFGESGTLTVAAGLTQILRTLSLPLCGYSGLMLPVLEDVGLGKRSEECYFNLDSLLLYSTVCGTGLDTIPIPGDASTVQIAAILTDVAALSGRLKKPLSVRLFPVPGLKAGDITQFDSPYLTNTAVMQL